MTDFLFWYIRRPLEKLPSKIAGMMPRWLVYHCAVRLIAKAVIGKNGNTIVSDLTVMDALKRWGDV